MTSRFHFIMAVLVLFSINWTTGSQPDPPNRSSLGRRAEAISPRQFVPDVHSDSQVFRGEYAYFQARNVKAAFSDGLEYKFEVNDGEAFAVGSSIDGSELNVEWKEDSTQRRIVFYFDRSGNTEYGYVNTSYGWQLQESRMYDSTEEWVYWYLWSENNTYEENSVWTSDSEIFVPYEKQVFHCDYMKLNYIDALYGTPSTGTLTAQDVFIAPYLAPGYDICEFEVHNPCRNATGGDTCRLVDGVVECIPEVALASVSPCRHISENTTEVPTTSSAIRVELTLLSVSLLAMFFLVV